MSQRVTPRILVIDDQAAIHEDYRKVLSQQSAGSTAALDRAAAELFDDDPQTIVTWDGFEIDSAFQGQEGLELVERAVTDRRPYALAFVDIRMPPGWDGVETVRRIWEIDPEILIVICSAYSDYSWQEMVRELGRNDRYLILRKPFDNIEVRQFAMALTERWSQSRTDVLTQLLNRRALRSYLDLEWKHTAEQLVPLSCAMLDLDHFKRINDSFGHQAGDEVLKQVAQTLVSKCRASDSVYRYGGEEICVLMPQTSEQDAVAWAESTRRAVEASPVVLEDRQLNMTVSIGVAVRSSDDDNPERLIDRADQALIVAKSAGRNRVVAASTITARTTADDPWSGVALIDLMSTTFVALRSSATVAETLQCFVRSPVGVVAVMDSEDAIRGVLSERELIELLPAHDRLYDAVDTIMCREFVACDVNSPASAVIALLERPDVNRVFVQREGQPIGFVSRGSVLRYWSRRNVPPGASGTTSALRLVGRLDRQQLARCAQRLSESAAKMLAESCRPGGEPSELSPTQLADLHSLVNDAWEFFLRGDMPPVVGQGPDLSGFGAPDAPLAPVG